MKWNFKNFNLYILYPLIVVVIGIFIQTYLNRGKKEFKIQVEKVEIINTNISKITIRLKNTGNQPILKSDFFNELTFNTDSNEIMDVKTIKVIPDNLNIKFIKTYKNQIQLSSTLLNENDELVFEIFTKGKIKNLLVDVRINGIEKDDLDCENDFKKEINFQLKSLEQYKNLKIIKAIYGFQDKVINVTDTLEEQIENNKIKLVAQNSEFGDIDPYIGKRKNLFVIYEYLGFRDSLRLDEDSILIIPNFRKIELKK